MIRLFPQIENIGFPHLYSSGFPSSGTYQRTCPPLFPLYLLSNLAAKIPLGSLLNLAHRSLFRPVCICPTEQSPLLDTIRISVLCFQDPSDALSVAYQCCIEIKIKVKSNSLDVSHFKCLDPRTFGPERCPKYLYSTPGAIREAGMNFCPIL